MYVNEDAVSGQRDGLHYSGMASAAQITHPTSTSPAHSGYRTLLLGLAILFASATIVYSVAWMYYVRATITVEVGMDTEPADNGVVVRDVWRDAPAQRSGLRAGDMITAINGRPISGQAGINAINAIWFESHPGETVHLTVLRAGVPGPLQINPVFRRQKGFGDTSLAKRGAARILGFYPLLFLVVGLAVLFLRFEDRNAWLLAMVFAGLIAQPAVPWALAFAPAVLRDVCYTYSAILKSLMPGLFYFFFAVFPTRSPIDRKLPWLKWLLLATGACLGWGGIPIGDLAALPFISHHVSLRTIGLTRLTVGYSTVVLGLISLLLNMFSVTRVEDRRKLKVMLWGTLVSIGPAVLIGLPYDLLRSETPFWLIFARAVLLFVMPLSFAYAVVKHRVMDIPVLLRRSARYFLVERGFAILILIFSVGITLWFGQAFSRRFSSGSKGGDTDRSDSGRAPVLRGYAGAAPGQDAAGSRLLPQRL